MTFFRLAYEELVEEIMVDDDPVPMNLNALHMNVNLRQNDDETYWFKEHYDALIKNLESIDFTGYYNSVLCLFGEKAFPISLNILKLIFYILLLLGFASKYKEVEGTHKTLPGIHF